MAPSFIAALFMTTLYEFMAVLSSHIFARLRRRRQVSADFREFVLYRPNLSMDEVILLNQFLNYYSVIIAPASVLLKTKQRKPHSNMMHERQYI